jgi:O-antigen/teichoic acid export membrane protein
MRKEVVSAFQISSVGILPAVISHVFRGVLEGKLRFKQANICKIFSGTTIFLAPLLVLVSSSKSLVEISAAIVLTRYLSLLMYIFFTTGLSTTFLTGIHSDHLTAIWKYGKWAAISGFISTMFVYGDRFFVAGYLKPEELSVYIASQDILIRYLLIPWSMALVLMPILSAKSTNLTEALNLYKRQQKRIYMISLTILLLLLLIIFLLVRVITFSNIPDIVFDVAFIQIVGVFFCSISQLPLIYLYAKGRPELVTAIYVFEMLIYISAAPFIFNKLGLTGACLVWSGRLILEYFLLRHFVNRFIRCS